MQSLPLKEEYIPELFIVDGIVCADKIVKSNNRKGVNTAFFCSVSFCFMGWMCLCGLKKKLLKALEIYVLIFSNFC
ncbi:hypothetical protein AM493_16615 [Flavobacterium akiainvivens]|uniref:Uncharacterized protein n=1 Tax=Flavobacterium akiainvivens TaxID=1202724 RepID=A0A0M8MK54_9FLAO|nr:hypothetical protein AM493_16615 [Flavobacterium akiainvivens]